MSLSLLPGVVDDLLESVFRIQLRKGLDPNNPQDFQVIAKALGDALKGKTGAAEAVALREALNKLDVDWPKLDEQQRLHVVLAARAVLSVPNTTLKGVEETFKASAQHVGLASMKSSEQLFGFGVKMRINAQDQKMLDAVVQHQVNFVRDEYGKRSDIFSAKAREIVQAGLEKGLDRWDIGKMLNEQLSAQQFKRSENYWTVISAAFTNRARTYGNLSSYNKAGITTYTVEAILDEKTSKVCRFMHGRRFRVGAALAKYAESEALMEPGDVKHVQPWLQVGRNEAGEEFIYPRADKGNALGTIVESGMGEVDNPGKYKNAKDDTALAQHGIMSPPFHGHCRTTIVPDTEMVVTGPSTFGPPTMAPAPEAPAPPPPPAFQLTPPLPLPPLAPRVPAPPPIPIPTSVQPLLPYGPGGIKPQPLMIQPEAGPPIEALIPPKDKKAVALEKLQALIDAGGGVDVITNPFAATGKKLAELTAKADLIDEAMKLVQKKEWKYVDTLKSAAKELDAKLIEKYIKDPKLLLKVEIRVVKIGNELHVLEGHEAVMASKLMEKWKLKVSSVNLKQYEKELKEKAKAAAAAADAGVPLPKKPGTVQLPVPPAIPKAVDPKVILAEKTGEAQGSNEGGFYRGSDGVNRYVKFYSDPVQAHGEALANALYGSLGFTSPQAVVFEHGGKQVYAATLLEGKTLATAGALTKESAREFMRGFVADVLMGNWDAAGQTADNAFLLPDGKVARIDNGGSFLMRAKAGRKPADLLNKITEWERFFDPSNPGYHKIAKAAGYNSPEDFKEVVKGEIQKVLALHKQWGDWGSFVDHYAKGLKEPDRGQVISMLQSRMLRLEMKLEELSKPPVPKIVGRERAKDWPGWRAPPMEGLAPVKGLRIQDLPEAPPPESPTGYRTLPSGVSKDDFNRDAKKKLKDVGADAMYGIERFTAGDFRAIRKAQMHEQRGEPYDKHYFELGKKVELAFKSAPPTPLTTYRGLNSMSKSVVEAMIQNEGVFRLGHDNTEATTSTSWNRDIATSFMGGSSEPYGDEYRVMLRIHQKSGIAVDPVSSNSGEEEVIMSRKATYRVLSAARWKGRQKIVMIELEEL